MPLICAGILLIVVFFSFYFCWFLFDWDERKSKGELDRQGKHHEFVFRLTSKPDLAALEKKFVTMKARTDASGLRLWVLAMKAELKDNSVRFRDLEGKTFWSHFNNKHYPLISTFRVDLLKAKVLWLGEIKNFWNCPELIWQNPELEDHPCLAPVSASEFSVEVSRRQEDYEKLIFPDLNLPGSVFAGLNLDRLEAQSACLQQTHLDSLSLRKADFKGSDLREAKFRRANLMSADFQNCELTEASFQNAVLCGANFFGADIKGADFREADIRSANFNCLNRELAFFDSGLPEPQAGLPGGCPLSYSTARDTISVNLDGLYFSFEDYAAEWNEYRKELEALNLEGWRLFTLSKTKSPEERDRKSKLSLQIIIKNHLNIDHPEYEGGKLYPPPPKSFWNSLDVGSYCGWLDRDYNLRHRSIESVEWILEPKLGWLG